MLSDQHGVANGRLKGLAMIERHKFRCPETDDWCQDAKCTSVNCALAAQTRPASGADLAVRLERNHRERMEGAIDSIKRATKRLTDRNPN